MSKQTWVETLTAAVGDGPAVTGTTNLSIMISASKYTFPNGYLDVPGKTLMVNARGRISTNTTTAGNLFFRAFLGTNLILESTNTAIALTAGLSNLTYELEFMTTVRASGNTANTISIGSFASTVMSGGVAVVLLPPSAPTTSAAFDATAALQFDLQAGFTNAGAGDTITCHQFTLQALN